MDGNSRNLFYHTIPRQKQTQPFFGSYFIRSFLLSFKWQSLSKNSFFRNNLRILYMDCWFDKQESHLCSGMFHVLVRRKLSVEWVFRTALSAHWANTNGDRHKTANMSQEIPIYMNIISHGNDWVYLLLNISTM